MEARHTSIHLTIVHDWYARFVIDQRWEPEYADLGGEFRVFRFHELDAVVVRIVVDCLELLEDFVAFVAVLAVEKDRQVFHVLDKHLNNFCN